MPDVLVILPAGVPPPALPEGVDVRPCATAEDVVAALGDATGDVVLCVDDISGDADLAAAIAAVEQTVIDVQQGSWDGETHSEVSAACSGVIAGFGFAGVSAAVALLRDRA